MLMFEFGIWGNFQYMLQNVNIEELFIFQSVWQFPANLHLVHYKLQCTWTSEITVEFLDKTKPLGVLNTPKKFATLCLGGNTFF